MRARHLVLAGALLGVVCGPAHADSQGSRDLGRDTLPADDGWTPTLHARIDSAAVADREVARGAGAGRLP